MGNEGRGGQFWGWPGDVGSGPRPPGRMQSRNKFHLCRNISFTFQLFSQVSARDMLLLSIKIYLVEIGDLKWPQSEWGHPTITPSPPKMVESSFWKILQPPSLRVSGCVGARPDPGLLRFEVGLQKTVV